jgi:hypothetical protein
VPIDRRDHERGPRGRSSSELLGGHIVALPSALVEAARRLVAAGAALEVAADDLRGALVPLVSCTLPAVPAAAAELELVARRALVAEAGRTRSAAAGVESGAESYRAVDLHLATSADRR